MPGPGRLGFSVLMVSRESDLCRSLVSVAAALDVADGVVRDVRLALGGVAHKP